MSSTFSIWEQDTYLAPRDVIIMGGGLVGLWSAWFLRQANPSLRITLVERGILPSGASTRNAGFACFGTAGEIVRDYQSMGRDQALQLVDMRFRGLEMITRYFPKTLLDYQNDGGHECFIEGPGYNSVMSALDDLNKDLRDITGHYPVFTPADASLSLLRLKGFDHLLFTPLEGALHSGKLVQALTQLVQASGVICLMATAITGWETKGDHIEVHTDQSFSLSCRQLLICTNGFAGTWLGQRHVRPARGQIVLTAPIPGLALKGTFHFDQGFFYFRNLDDRILLGGARNLSIEEEATTDMVPSARIQKALDDFLRDHLPQSDGVPVTHRWAGIMGMGDEKRPLIKEVSENVYCAVRLSGIGVAISAVVGKQVSALMTSALILWLLLVPSFLSAQTPSPYSFGVTISGQGPPMIFIPGLKGDGEGTFASTIAHYKEHFTCYAVTLAGFAGQPPSGRVQHLLQGQRDELLRYIKEQHLNKPILVGFSFGGVLALWMACTDPGLFGPIIDIDGVPYEQALEDPGINSDSLAKINAALIARVMAFTPARIARIDSVRHTVMDQLAGFDFLKRLVTDVRRIPLIVQWDTASDIRSSLLMELEMRPLDLRSALSALQSPLLVLGSWKGYDRITNVGQAQTAYGRQFTQAPRVYIRFSAEGRHFLMWDDFKWMTAQMDDFLNVPSK